eukprot:Awhi_evm1s12826
MLINWCHRNLRVVNSTKTPSPGPTFVMMSFGCHIFIIGNSAVLSFPSLFQRI